MNSQQKKRNLGPLVTPLPNDRNAIKRENDQAWARIFVAVMGCICARHPDAQLGNYFERRVYLPDQKIIMEGEEPRYGAPRSGGIWRC